MSVREHIHDELTPQPGPAARRSDEHFVQFYEKDEVLVQSIADYVSDGLAAGRGVVMIATAAHMAEVEQQLLAQGFDLLRARGRGQLQMLDAHAMLAALMADEWPQPAGFAAVIEPVIADLISRFPGVIAFGEMVAILWHEGRYSAAVRLEQLWNDLGRRYSFSLFCAYPANEVREGPFELLKQVCCEHTRTIPPNCLMQLDKKPAVEEVSSLRERVHRLEAEVRERKAMESKLARREHELHDFLENAAVLMHSVGPDGRLLWANRAELEFLGYSAGEYIGHHISEFHVDADLIEQMLQRLLAGEAVQNQPAQMRCKDGSIRHVLIHSNGFWEDGHFLHTRCVSLDITARLLLQEATRERNEVAQEAERTRALLAAIVESSDDAIVSKTLDGQITSWNGGAARLFGYSAEEIVGRPITDIIPRELRDEERRILEKLRRGERIDHFETVRVTKDGRRVEVSLTVSPVRDAAGNIIGASKVARDITGPRKAHRELKRLRDELAEELAGMRRLHEISTRLVRQQDRMETLLQEVLQAAMEISGEEQGCIQLCEGLAPALTTAVRHGLSADFCALLDRENVGRVAVQAVDGDYQRLVIEDMAEASGALCRLLRPVLHDAGIQAMQVTPLIRRDGKLSGVLSVFGSKPHRPSDRELRQLDLLARLATDLIERAKAEVALREADQRKNEFLAILAHELRNPLAPIRYAVAIAKQANLAQERRTRVEEVIERQVEHMARLLDDLLDVSRITRGKLELRKSRVELTSAVAAAVEAARPLLDAKRHTLTVALPPRPIRLEADPVRLAQIFSNLLTNAAKYTDPGGHIELTAEESEREVIVRIHDNGIGMTPEMMPCLFNMFVQTKSALERSEGGLGIGLALVRGLVTLHGGTVDGNSEGPGKGSEFTVRLPIGAAQPEKPPQPAGQATAPPGAALKVLVADDNRDIADTCGILVELFGHQAIVTYSGEKALEYAAKMRPDVLLLDIGMPDLNGYELAKRIRAESWGARMTLAAITGWGQEEDKRHAFAAGFDWHLTKPIDPASLERLLLTPRSVSAADTLAAPTQR